ncbi:MAG: AsmA family protein [Deltaproteobacteria bacterium]|nr:AsmA family protein [Deltaproteobacteria bacterium]
MRISKLVLFIVIGLLLLVVVAITALLFVDPSIFRGQLEARASAAFGRQFQIAGPISLERSLRPRIVLEDTTIGNPAWASREHFARVEKVSVQVALLPLLRGDLRVLDVLFAGVELFIEEGPDGANNYTFGDSSGSREPRGLPAIEQLLIRDATIYHQSADAGISRYEIAEARLWNIPGQPERIEAEGLAKGMPVTILLAADTPAELSGPQKPWSLKLDMQGPDMSLAVEGRMEKAFVWDTFDYRIAISGNQVDALEKLFDLEFPTTGPFKISAAVNAAEGLYSVTDFVAHVHGAPGTPDIKITNGDASGGQNHPLLVELQGKYGDAPLALTFKSEQTFEVSSQTTPWPLEARLNLADIQFDVRGTVSPATAGESFELDGQLQGETLTTLAQLLGSELPKAGPYQFSFRTRFGEGSYEVTDLEGYLRSTELWKKIHIVQGKASAHQNGFVKASVEAKLDNVPLSLSFQGGSETSGEANTTDWPVQLEASAVGAVLMGHGSVLTTNDGKTLQLATRIKGNRFDRLGSLVGVSLPRVGAYDVSAFVSSGGGVHELRDLRVQMGANRFTGSVRWEDKAPRPLLTAKLSSDRLTLNELLETGSKPSSKKRKDGLLDRPIKLDWLRDFDTNLDFEVKRVADSPIAVEKVRSAVKVANGNLNVSFRGTVATAPIEGNIRLIQRRKVPNISLKADIGRIDAGQTLKQLELPEMVVGTVDGANLEGSSRGKTLHALLEQAAITLQIRPAKVNYTANFAAQKVDVTFQSAEFVARQDQPVTATFTGTLQDVPFNATVSGVSLAGMRTIDTVLPVRVALQTPDVQFRAEGTIAKPFDMKEFDLEHEITGKEIEGLAPLIDFAVPLRGEFRATGRVSARGSRFTYEEDLRIGKTDLKANITVVREPPRPTITGNIFTRELHLDDVKLFYADKDSGPEEDRSRLIPDYTIPIDALSAVDLDLDIRAERILTGIGDLGDLVSKVNLKDGRFKSSLSITGFTGAEIRKEFDLNGAVKPPLNRIRLDAKDLNYGFLQSEMMNRDLIDGRVDLYVNLSGPGATRRSFLGNADGRITIIAGPGKITGRRLDLWASDLLPTLLSPRWQRQPVTEMNCMVAHIELQDGLAKIEDILLDTQRITIAGSGIVDLETEELDVFLAPRPKRASLVSLANPVEITGTLSQPEVSVARLPRRRWLGRGAGIAGSFINPAFLVLVFSDTGTSVANPCVAAVERAHEIAEVEPR